MKPDYAIQYPAPGDAGAMVLALLRPKCSRKSNLCSRTGSGYVSHGLRGSRCRVQRSHTSPIRRQRALGSIYVTSPGTCGDRRHYSRPGWGQFIPRASVAATRPQPSAWASGRFTREHLTRSPLASPSGGDWLVPIITASGPLQERNDCNTIESSCRSGESLP